MGMLQPVVSTNGYAKIGCFGETGCGKSTTAILLALGILKHFKIKNKTIAYFDTENAVGWLTPLAEFEGAKIVCAPTRAFQDIEAVMHECLDEGIEVLVIDSITSAWRELVKSFKGSKGYVRIDEWGTLKDQWNDHFATPFVRSNLHVIMCGRSSNVFEEFEEDGKEKMKKVGTRMASEKETGHEPDLLIEMRRLYNSGDGKYGREMSVVKDRSRAIDGMTRTLVMPMQKNGEPDEALLVKINEPNQFVLPHLLRLSIGAKNSDGADIKRTSATLAEDASGAKSRAKGVERDVQIDEIHTQLAKHFPGSTVQDKKAKADLLQACFETSNATHIKTQMHFDRLQQGVQHLTYLLSEEMFDSRMMALAQGISGDGKRIEDANAAANALTALLDM